eukprot:TRINITY_DN14775_c0_g1_i2.p1 TRINITY_DN14775_c0_g1~~TRINITY_DN14775_c0_g1_i2.p1  ORF type:complete len:265 (+),score=9.19 TRINITY_DN14775_c0_g1_i2:218-1012(+)
MDPVKSCLTQVDSLPLSPLARIKLINTTMAPKILYALECCPVTPEFIAMAKHIDSLAKGAVLKVRGLPKIMSPKTWHGRRPGGLGLVHFATAIINRILDTTHKQFLKGHESARILKSIEAAATALGATAYSRSISLFARRQHRTAIPPHPTPVESAELEWYTDGSMRGNSAVSAITTLSAPIAVARPYGPASIYKAELLAITMATSYAPVGSTVYSDSKGAVAAINSRAQRITLAPLINVTRQNMVSKGIQVVWTKGLQATWGT